MGVGRTGKTTYILKLLGIPTQTYTPTVGVAIHQLPLQYEKNGQVNSLTINIWDCAGRSQLKGPREIYYSNCHAAIIMFSSIKSLHVAIRYLHDFRTIVGTQRSVIFVWNKWTEDDPHNINTQALVDKLIPSECHLFKINTKTDYNCWAPIVNLIETLTNNKSLT